MAKPLIHEAVFALAIDLKIALADVFQELDVGVTALHIRALRLIWSKENTTSLEISKTLRRDKAQVTRIVNDLLERKLVERVANPDDKRSHYLVATAKGRKIFEKVAESEAKLQADLLKGITAKEAATFVSVAKKVSENVRNIES